MPFNRNETLQEGLGIPLPASTQWDIVADQAERAEPAFEEMVRQAAQADVVYNDDTTVKILAAMDRQARTEDLVDTGAVQAPSTNGRPSSGEDSAEMAGEAAGSGTAPAAEKPEGQHQRRGHLYSRGHATAGGGGLRVRGVLRLPARFGRRHRTVARPAEGALRGRERHAGGACGGSAVGKLGRRLAGR